MLNPRAAALLAGVGAFAGFSLDRFPEPGGVRPPPDLMSQSERIADPARRYLASRLAPGIRIGCLDANPDWSDECDYFYYTLLPDFVRKAPAGKGLGEAYVLFAANPHASQTPAEQASAIPGYRIELELPQAVFLLARNAP